MFIIAVTGVAGHGFGSWAKNAESMWLRDELPREFPTACIMVYGYNSRLEGDIKHSLQTHLERFSIELASLMNTLAQKGSQRRVIFLGHSLGCLLIIKVCLLPVSLQLSPVLYLSRL